MVFREKSKLREDDIRQSTLVSEFLDKTFYKNVATNVERIEDKARQIQGIDTIFEYNDFKYLCDEKAAIRYRGLKTYTLELSFINRYNQIQEGWLINENEKNNSFLLIWVENDCIEVALVKRQAIFDYLESLGWTLEKLREKSNKIRCNPLEKLGTLEENKCKFIFSRQLVEKPINIQLPKDTYIEIADYHGVFPTAQFARY